MDASPLTVNDCTTQQTHLDWCPADQQGSATTQQGLRRPTKTPRSDAQRAESSSKFTTNQHSLQTLGGSNQILKVVSIKLHRVMQRKMCYIRRRSQRFNFMGFFHTLSYSDSLSQGSSHQENPHQHHHERWSHPLERQAQNPYYSGNLSPQAYRNQLLQKTVNQP